MSAYEKARLLRIKANKDVMAQLNIELLSKAAARREKAIQSQSKNKHPKARPKNKKCRWCNAIESDGHVCTGLNEPPKTRRKRNSDSPWIKLIEDTATLVKQSIVKWENQHCADRNRAIHFRSRSRKAASFMDFPHPDILDPLLNMRQRVNDLLESSLIPTSSVALATPSLSSSISSSSSFSPKQKKNIWRRMSTVEVNAYRYRKELASKGWIIVENYGSHFKYTSPDGKQTFSSVKAVNNYLGNLRKAISNGEVERSSKKKKTTDTTSSSSSSSSSTSSPSSTSSSSSSSSSSSTTSSTPSSSFYEIRYNKEYIVNVKCPDCDQQERMFFSTLVQNKSNCSNVQEVKRKSEARRCAF